jgi:mono/diheme cytochrome c family protein
MKNVSDLRQDDRVGRVRSMPNPKRPMRLSKVIFLGVTFVFFTGLVRSQQPHKNSGARPADLASGEKTFVRYCASCHGVDGTGNGPVAPALKPPPTDLTTISKRNHGKYPAGFVGAFLKFGRNLAAHGSQEMPVWGSRFKLIDPKGDPTGQRHIDDVVAYIESLQIN